jgi:hypothetical protein
VARANSNEDKVRLLHSVAFLIHRKRPAVEALAECFESEGKGGRHRQFRQAVTVLEAEGFVPALAAAELIGAEAAAILATVDAAGDHRLLAAALNAVADYLEQAV